MISIEIVRSQRSRSAKGWWIGRFRESVGDADIREFGPGAKDTFEDAGGGEKLGVDFVKTGLTCLDIEHATEADHHEQEDQGMPRLDSPLKRSGAVCFRLAHE